MALVMEEVKKTQPACLLRNIFFSKTSFRSSKFTFEVFSSVSFGKPRVVCWMETWQGSSSRSYIVKEQKTGILGYAGESMVLVPVTSGEQQGTYFLFYE